MQVQRLGICKTVPEEASMATPDQDYGDKLFLQLSQQLDSNPALLVEEQSSSTSPEFTHPISSITSCTYSLAMPLNVRVSSKGRGERGEGREGRRGGGASLS